ncbi:MAG: PIG-L deacetylase family protein [Coriobacteriia bacterium]|nr:PIG-L deacetylase family protein [Coriobacteriia bacterium]
MSKRRRTILIVIALVVTAIGGAAAYVLRPGAHGSGFRLTSLTDPAAAKAAGDSLLGLRDATVLVVVAHPDDLEYYAGGTAISLAKNNKVILLMGTSGEKGAGGWAGVAKVRERLQLETAKIAGYSEVVFLRHPDQGLGDAVTFPDEVKAAFQKYRPKAILTFDAADEAVGYRHADHEAAGRTAAAVAQALGGTTLYLFSSSKPDVIVDYAPVAETKAKAFAKVGDYRTANPFYAGLVAPILRLRNGPLGPTYGMRAGVPDVGVEFGEVFRQVIVK